MLHPDQETELMYSYTKIAYTTEEPEILEERLMTKAEMKYFNKKLENTPYLWIPSYLLQESK